MVQERIYFYQKEGKIKELVLFIFEKKKVILNSFNNTHKQAIFMNTKPTHIPNNSQNFQFL